MAAPALTHTVTDKAVYFWKPPSFSNWTITPFTYLGVNFNCPEQALMYHKAKMFGDISIASQILRTSDPQKHKELGRKVIGFKQEIWDEKKYPLMVAILKEKFLDPRNEYHLSELLKCKGKMIVEASPRDNIWGVGLSIEKCMKTENSSKWKGQNLLGKALEEVLAYILGKN